MNKKVTMIGVGMAVLLSMVISSTTFAQDDFTPVIMNPNFEDSVNRDDNRDAWRNGDLEDNADLVYGDGSWVLQMSTSNHTENPPVDQGFSGKLPTGTDSTSAQRWLYQAITLEANKTYKISWFMKQSSGNSLNVSIYNTVFNTVDVIGDESSIIASQDYNDDSGSNTGDYIEQSIEFETGDVTEVVLFITNDWKGGSSSMNIDDFSIEEVSDDVIVVVPEIPYIMNPNFEDSVTRDDNREAWRNSDLEDDADLVYGDGSWVLQTSGTNNTPDAPVDQGYSAKLPTGTDSTSAQRWLYQAIPLEANKKYEISWFMKQSSGNTLTVEVYNTVFNTVSVIGDETAIIASQDYNDDSGSNTGDFIEQSIEFETGDVTEVVLFITNDWKGGSSSVNLDDFSIEEVEDIIIVMPEIPYIKNGDFEEFAERDDNRGPWRNTDLEDDADLVYGDGSWVLQMSTSNHTENPPVDQGFSGKLPTGTDQLANSRWIYQEIEVEQNKSYEISWFMKQESGNTLYAAIYDSVFSTVDIIDDEDYIIASEEYNDLNGSSTGDFVEVSISFKSEDNESVVLFITNDYMNGTSSANIDDVTIEEVEDIIIVVPEIPYIVNADFEDYAVRDDNRTPWRNGALENDADLVYGDGSWVLQMSTSNHTENPPVDQGFSGKLPTGTDSTSAQRWLYQPVAVEPNVDYIISWYMKQDSGNTLNVAIYDSLFSTVNVIGNEAYIMTSADFGDATESNTGEFLEESIGFNSGDNDYVVLFITNDWKNGTNSVNVDDFSIIEGKLGVSNEDEDSDDVVSELKLSQNYPNPFNPSTQISYSIPSNANVKLEVFNMLGQVVATLVDGKQMAGEHSVSFNANNLTSGVYFYRISSGATSVVKRMTLIK